MKKFSFAVGIGFCAVLLLSGCSSALWSNPISDAVNAGETSELNIVKNKTSKADVFKAIGAPSLVFQGPKGETWVYQRIAVNQNNAGVSGSANVALVFPYKEESLRSGGGLVGGGASASVGASNTSYKTAGLMIRFNEQGCVNSYEFTATSF